MGNAKSGGFVYYFLIDMVLVGLQRELAIGKMVAAIETLRKYGQETEMH